MSALLRLKPRFGCLIHSVGSSRSGRGAANAIEMQEKVEQRDGVDGVGEGKTGERER